MSIDLLLVILSLINLIYGLLLLFSISYHSLAAGSKIGQEIKSTFISGFHRLKDAPRPKMADIFKKKDRFDS